MTTDYATPVTAVQLDLDRPGVIVQPALDLDVERAGQCEWCGDVDALATIRVYGDPHPDVSEPIRCEDICPGCAPGVIDRALAEHDDRSPRDITVETAR